MKMQALTNVIVVATMAAITGVSYFRSLLVLNAGMFGLWVTDCTKGAGDGIAEDTAGGDEDFMGVGRKEG